MSDPDHSSSEIDDDIDADTNDLSDDSIPDNSERLEIREKLSAMSFEELLNMKEEMGLKLFNQTVHGKIKPTNKQISFKRANKNRPREMSSKIRPNPKVQSSSVYAENNPQFRDPRFDPLCGTYVEKSFKTNYQFIYEIKEKEKDEIKKELESCNDESRTRQLKYLLQRLENQLREQRRKDDAKQKSMEYKKDIKTKLRQGETPDFKKKSIQKLEGLIEKYENLRNKNKLKQYIEKRNKKQTQKEKRNLKVKQY